jgi:hypothetical protein
MDVFATIIFICICAVPVLMLTALAKPVIQFLMRSPRLCHHLIGFFWFVMRCLVGLLILKILINHVFIKLHGIL